MREKFQNIYRIPSSRLKEWDYDAEGAYFITICLKDHACLFGEIAEGRMWLNEAGKLAEKFWIDIPNRFPFTQLEAFVIMPNHLHAILIISPRVETRFIASPTALRPTKPDQKTRGGATGKHNPMLLESISRIVRWYKGRTSFEIRKMIPAFAWQSRFYDHIIRDQQASQRIQNYILTNPENWKGDKFYR